MGNCWFRGSSYVNRVSSTAKSETPKIQSPSERDRSDESKLPSNAREVEAMRLESAARNPLTAFSFEELRKVTNGFRQDSLIGGGGFGRVYKGAVGTEEPLQVAVKVHDGDNSFQGHREWLAEVIFLGHLSHPNLVKLVGYCCEDDHRVLVYEYMPLGSVESHLFSRRPADAWHLPPQTVAAGPAAVTGGGTAASLHRPLTARRGRCLAALAGGGTSTWRACRHHRWWHVLLADSSGADFDADGADSHADCLRFGLSVILRVMYPV